jgi:hypothetical protein
MPKAAKKRRKRPQRRNKVPLEVYFPPIFLFFHIKNKTTHRIACVMGF